MSKRLYDPLHSQKGAKEAFNGYTIRYNNLARIRTQITFFRKAVALAPNFISRNRYSVPCLPKVQECCNRDIGLLVIRPYNKEAR